MVISGVRSDSSVDPGSDRPRSSGRLSGLARHRRFLGLGLAGQVLTLVGMVVPILLRETEQVFVLVFASAVALLLVNAGLLAYPFVFPVLRGPRLARVATVLSSATMLVVATGVTALSFLEPALDLPRGTFASSAALTVTWGLYTVLVTRLVRVGDTVGIGLARIYYGVAVISTTLAACLIEWGPLALTFGNAIAYAVPLVVLVWRRSHWGPDLPPLSRAHWWRLGRAYLKRAGRPAAASLAGGWTSLLPGLILPGLGAAAEPWAIVSRICGGFANLLYTLATPPLEARLSRAVRERDAGEYGRARRTALLVGGGTAAIAVLASLGLALYATEQPPQEWFVPIAVATALFWGSMVAVSLINRLPNFLGRDSERLYWDISRAVLVSVAILLTDDAAQLVAMGVVLAVFGVLLLPLSRWRSR